MHVRILFIIIHNLWYRMFGMFFAFLDCLWADLQIQYLQLNEDIEIRYACNSDKADLLILPGRGSFIERYYSAINRLNRMGYSACILDWPSQGGSTRLASNRQKNHIMDYKLYLDSLNLVLQKSPNKPILFASSLGGHVALRYAAEYGNNRFSDMILIAPMLEIQTGYFPMWFAKFLSYVMPKIGLEEVYCFGFHDFKPPPDFPKEWLEYTSGGPTFAWLGATFDSNKILLKKLRQRFSFSVLWFSAGKDEVVDNCYDAKISKLIGAKHLICKDSNHQILQSKDAEAVWDEIGQFLANSRQQKIKSRSQ